MMKTRNKFNSFIRKILGLGVFGAGSLSANASDLQLPQLKQTLEPNLKPEFEKLPSDSHQDALKIKSLISFYSQHPEKVTMNELDVLIDVFEKLPTPVEAKTWSNYLIQNQRKDRVRGVDKIGNMSFGN